MSQVPPLWFGVFEQSSRRRLHPREASQEAGGRPPGLEREPEGSGRKRGVEEAGRGVGKERKGGSRERSRGRTPQRHRGRKEGRRGQQFEYEFIQEEKEKQEKEKEKEVQAFQSTRKERPQEDLRVHRFRPQPQSTPTSHEVGAKSHEEQEQGRLGRLLVQQHGGEQRRGGTAFVRGDPQDQKGRDQRTRGVDSLHDLERVEVPAHPTRVANRGDRWSSAA